MTILLLFHFGTFRNFKYYQVLLGVSPTFVVNVGDTPFITPYLLLFFLLFSVHRAHGIVLGVPFSLYSSKAEFSEDLFNSELSSIAFSSFLIKEVSPTSVL